MSSLQGFRRSLPRLLTVLGIIVICTGTSSSRSCSSGIGGGGDDDDDEPDFVTRLEIQDANGQITDTFERGELVQMVLTVRNRRDEVVSVDFPTTRTFDFVVVRENSNDVVWQLSDSAGAAPPSTIETTLDFAPNETQTFTTTWSQVDNDGDNVSTGAYEARGVLVYDGFDSNPLRPNQLGSTLERFTIN
jgi:Intracellular proteinase inhibitor